MTDPEKKGMVLFCYAIALAVRKLDDGNFEGLDRQTFLVQVEGQFEEGIKTLDPEDRPTAGRHGRLLIVMVRSLIESHETDLARFPSRILCGPRRNRRYLIVRGKGGGHGKALSARLLLAEGSLPLDLRPALAVKPAGRFYV